MRSRHFCCHQPPRRGGAGAVFRWGFTLLSVAFFAHGELGAAAVTGFLAWAGWQAAPEKGGHW